MSAGAARDAWESANAYEQYVGRWSRMVAVEFLRWLAPAPGQAWADVGCGTGALTAALLAGHAPAALYGLDRSGFILAETRRWVSDRRVHLARGDAVRLPWASRACGAAVSGLVLNFAPDPAAMVREMARVTRPGGVVALYVWDYHAGMQLMRYFWDAVKTVCPQDAGLDESDRFPLCQPGPLRALFREAGLRNVAGREIVVPTHFDDFEAYWRPFLGGTGSAPTYLASVSEQVRAQIRQDIQHRLPAGADGRIELTARAFAVRGTV